MDNQIVLTGEKNNYKIAQSYQMIEAKLNISSLALNIFYFVAMQVDSKKDNNFFEYSILKVDLDKQLGLNIDYNALERVAKELTSKSINIQDINKSGFKYRALFSVCDYENGVLTFEIHKDLKEHFIKLKENFVSVDFLKYAVGIKSIYAKRMYFMLKQRSKSKRGFWEYKLSDLKDILVTPKYMDRYKEFRIHVLDKTVEEVNKHTDLKVFYEEMKTGRSVTGVRFFIEKSQKAIEIEEAKAEKDSLKEEKKMAQGTKSGNKDIDALGLWYIENGVEDNSVPEAEVVDQKLLS